MVILINLGTLYEAPQRYKRGVHSYRMFKLINTTKMRDEALYRAGGRGRINARQTELFSTAWVNYMA